MSTATAFVSVGSFPFCPSDLSGTGPYSGYSYVGNLTLAQVMAFFWNLESFTLTFTGTASDSGSGESIDAGGTVTLSPPASTLFTQGSGNGSVMHASSFSNVAIASCPSVREPRERVCAASNPFRVLHAFWGPGSTGKFGNLGFWLGTDPSNSGKCRIYYDFDFTFESKPNEFAIIRWNDSVGTLANGTITIGGITLNWFSSFSGTSATGGTLSATSISFTY